ncbi:hypothetical protein D5018_08550 [Parashewanella curva]|uniref:Competence protein CoiA nuclease-like domain-containing protein n=1 Tax=Parashewanella curva TaxID=2338552 RepID=A0A3L8PXX5_9GAMM|nr:competence protein CoiA family protein [Parashewanella curva]RLV60174.1 hypothetical protein D5018_08550 [Parashewanella curva]
MPFIGKDKSTGDRINILHLEDPRRELTKDQVVCPYCGSDMFIRGHLRSKPTIHFVHKDICPSSYKSHPESPEHLYFKEYLAKNLVTEFSEYSEAHVELEFPLDSLKRIIDVAFKFPNGWIVAHEVQLSSITPFELEERTRDYKDEGIDVVWWLGKDANTISNRDWCHENLSECFVIDYEILQEQTLL